MSSDAETTITFPKLNHFWIDSGLLGLYESLRSEENEAVVMLDESGVTIKGEQDAVVAALERAYGALVKKYYDISTKRQLDDRTSYNFYFDSLRLVFVAFPKRRARGIARLTYDRAPRPVNPDMVVKWERKERRDVEVGDKVIRRTRGVLPPSHAHLQESMDAFLDTHGLDVTTIGLLIDGPNEVRPRIPALRQALPEGESLGTCFLCGKEAHLFVDANQTIFPFITGASGVRSFNTLIGRPERVCWRCAFVAKFVPVNGFYMDQPDQIFAFFPFSNSLTKMHEVYGMLQDFTYDDPQYRKNFKHLLPVGDYADGFFQRPFEITFAFLYTLYRKLLVHEAAADKRSAFDWERMIELTLAKAPLEFVILHAVKKGDTYLGKLVWPFRQTVYFFRLMDALETAHIDIKQVMRLLVDQSKSRFEHKTLVRNRICEAVLKQDRIASLIEAYVFSADLTYIKPLADFVQRYENIIRKEGVMTAEEREAAVKLGRRVGTTVGTAAKERGRGASKGDLFKLRKTQKKVDFLGQLNRLQFKYDLSIPREVYEGQLTDEYFLEFKNFCMIAALNSFFAATRSGKQKE